MQHISLYFILLFFSKKLAVKFMFRCKGIDRSIYEIGVFYGFPINYYTSFRNDDFSSFRNYTKDWQDCGSEK